MRNRKGHLQTPVFSKQRFPSQHSWSTAVGALHQIQVPVSGKGASCLIDHIMVASVASSGSRCCLIDGFSPSEPFMERKEVICA